MAPRKRARTSSTSVSSSSSTTVTTVELSGGWALSPELVQLWRSGRLTDTVVEVDGRSFAAHRVVLASACDYFNRHYDNEHMRDADHPKLLEHVTAAAFEPLLAFLYEGTCTFDESLLAPVLRAASYLHVAPLEKAAVAALTERLSPSNALAMWTWGEELELPELAEAAKEAALKSFDELEKIEEATLAHVQTLVADDRLTAKSEEVVFSAVVRFAEAKQPAEAELHGLLRTVRFTLMSTAFLLGTVRTWPMLDTKAGQALLFEMMAPLASGPAQQLRMGFGARFLYVLGGGKDLIGGLSARIATVEVYDAESNVWSGGIPLPSPRETAASAVLDGKIYLLGGLPDDDDGSVNAVAFDLQTRSWDAAPPMLFPRDYVAAVTLGSKLYVIGGDQTSVEAFDHQTGVWAEVAFLEHPRYMSSAAVLNGKIYVSGGQDFDDDIALNTVEMYDPQTDTWATASPMATGRRCCASAALGGKLYVAGGIMHEDERRLSSMEAFDPQTNTWAAVASMSTPRSMFSLTTLRGKLYAVGGLDADDITLATVEMYDPEEDRWEAVAPLALARNAHSAAAS